MSIVRYRACKSSSSSYSINCRFSEINSELEQGTLITVCLACLVYIIFNITTLVVGSICRLHGVLILIEPGLNQKKTLTWNIDGDNK